MGRRTTYHLETLAENRALQLQNETLWKELEQKQIEIQGLWRTTARAYRLWQRAELDIRRQKISLSRQHKLIRRLLADLREQEDPDGTPPCSPPTI